MNKNLHKVFLLIFPIFLLQNCSDGLGQSEDESLTTSAEQSVVSVVSVVSVDEGMAEVSRWYSLAQLDRGRDVFALNCAVCHGAEAEGTVPDWRTRLDDGSFPPPPLNGSAHAWHHPQQILLRVIDYGGEAFGGKMPAFDDVLEQSDKLAAIAYFQNFWTDEIYQQWMQMGGAN